MDTNKTTQFEHLDAARFHRGARPQRHVACNPCREAKVKCDGGNPVCKRCGNSQFAYECSYTRPAVKRGRPRKTGQKTNQPPQPRTPSDASTTATSPGALGWVDETDSSSTSAISFGIQTSIFGSEQSGSRDSVNAASFGGTAVTWPGSCEPFMPAEDESIMGDSSADEDIDMADRVIENFQAALQVDISPPDPLYPGLTEPLVSIYFTSCQQTFTLFGDQKALNSSIEQPGYEAVALKHAVCAHGVAFRARSNPVLKNKIVAQGLNPSIASADQEQANLYYRLARASLNQSDMGKKSATTLLRSLQATILTGLYELQQAEISCAWLSVSRLVWLVDELRLYWLDSSEAFPALVDEEHQQAARRAFWAASGLASFLMTICWHIGFMPPAIEEITTYIPNGENLESLRIMDVFHGTLPRLISEDEGLSAIRILTSRVLMHAKHATKRKVSDNQLMAQSYNFWTHHSHLEESLHHLRIFIKASPTNSTAPKLKFSLLELQTQTLTVILGETKLVKMASRQGLLSERHQFQACGDLTRQNALDLAAALEVTETKLPSDAAFELTLSWATCVALQSLLRCQRRQRMNWFGADASVPTAAMAFVAAVDPVPYALPWPSATTSLFDALLLDTFEALQSRLAELVTKIPAASLFAEQIKVEIPSSNEELSARVVGLVESARFEPHA